MPSSNSKLKQMRAFSLSMGQRETFKESRVQMRLLTRKSLAPFITGLFVKLSKSKYHTNSGFEEEKMKGRTIMKCMFTNQLKRQIDLLVDGIICFWNSCS